MRICPFCKRKYESAETRFCAEDGQPLIENVNQISHSHQPAIEQVTEPFSASLAMTLFANRFIENVPFEEFGTEVFCQSNVKVKSWRFITEVPMIAFWYLHENNCIRFIPTVKTGFLRNSPTLVIEANSAAQVNIPGLEYDFWEIIKRSSPGITVESVFKKFLGGKTMAPEMNLAKRLIEWMIQLGYGQPDNSPKPFFRLGKIPLFEKFAPDCRRIATCEHSAQNIQRHWIKFRAEQPDIFYYLFDDIIDAGWNNITSNQSRHSLYFDAIIFRDHGET